MTPGRLFRPKFQAYVTPEISRGVAGRRSSTPRANKQRKKSAKISPISRRKPSNIQPKRTVSPMLHLYAIVFVSAWRHPCSRLAIVENFALLRRVKIERNKSAQISQGRNRTLNIQHQTYRVAYPPSLCLCLSFCFATILFRVEVKKVQARERLDEFRRASPHSRFRRRYFRRGARPKILNAN